MKKFKNIFLAILVLLSSTVIAQDYRVDVSKSDVHWIGKKVSGQHEGSITLKSGSFTLSNNKISAGEFVMDMTTITNSDLEGDWNAKLVGHLNSDDFFGTTNYPTAKLVVVQSSSFKNGVASVKGNLTIKGKTHPVEFLVKQSGKIFTTTLTVDRTLYDIKYGSGKFFDDLGDKMIDDTFILEVTLNSK
jgi:polyisoprenoid-binding protein YceI